MEFVLASLSQILPIAATAAPSSPPAGGAALDQILIANVMAAVASGLLAWLVLGHRSGRLPYLGRAAAQAERLSGLPGWAALPSAISAISLFVALLGMYWDIALHIDVGRDEGPLANPAHYLILVGLFGIFCAGFVAMALPLERPGPTAVRVAPGWYAPLGGVLVTACAFFSLLGFPLDDVWHRLFGQDVTLWGPTHLMLIGGASMTLIGMAVLLVEGMRARGGGATQQRVVVRMRRVGLMGGLLIGLSAFQAEFDFGVPQFQMIFHPMLLALSAGVALVCGRLWIGRGGALGTVAFFLVVRGAMSVLVGPVFGETTPHLPLYLAEAACVEVAALWLARRPLGLSVVSGVLIGTVGFAAEYGFSQLGMPIPWTEALLPGGVVLATIAGVAGGLIGAMMAGALRAALPGRALARAVSAVALAATMALVANGLVTTAPDGVRASVVLRDVSFGNGGSGSHNDVGNGAGGREVAATIRMQPPDAARNEHWLTATAWQGGGLVVDNLKRVGEGVYRTTQPIPVYGDWKSMVRLQVGRTIAAVPIYLPADPAIPAPAVPAPVRFDRAFQTDKQILQRETKQGVPTWLRTVAPLVVMLIALTLIATLAIGLARLGRATDVETAAGGTTAGPLTFAAAPNPACAVPLLQITQQRNSGAC